MTDTPLTRPIFVRHAAGLVLELASLGDAIDFLEEWPVSDRQRPWSGPRDGLADVVRSP